MLLALLLAATEEFSTIAVPIRATLAPLVPQIEAHVPKTFGNTVREKRYSVTYQVERDPVTLRMVGTGLHSRTTAHYSVLGCPNRFPCISCGIREVKRQAILTLDTHFVWDPSWRLRSVTTAFPAQFPNRCRVTLLNVDITDRYIAPVMNTQLRDVARTIDANTPSLTNIRPLAQQIWSSLQSPFELAPRTWLLFEPQQVALGPVRGEGLQVASTLAMTGRTRVVIGEKPAAVSRPLPPLRSAEVAGGLRIPFDVHIPYSEASRLATAEFGHRTHKAGRADLRIESIRVSPAPGGKITVQADIDYRRGRLRRYAGPVVLVGTPRIDGATVVVPDLDYILEGGRRSFLASVAERLAHDTLRQQLRESAKWPLAPYVVTVRQELNRALERQLAPGVAMRGAVTSVEPRTVTAADSIVVNVTISGEAEVTVNR